MRFPDGRRSLRGPERRKTSEASCARFVDAAPEANQLADAWRTEPLIKMAYGSDKFRGDVVAGVTAAAIVAPKALASADLAGLPVQMGLYTALAAMLAYAAIGTSRPLSVSTTATVALLAGAAIADASEHAGASPVAAAGTLAILVGLWLAAAAALRLGFLTNFLSELVLTGFKTGTGLLIVVSMAAPMVGVALPPGQSIVLDVIAVAAKGAHWHWPTIALALSTLALIAAVEKFAHWIPAYLAAGAAGIALTYVLDLPALGITLSGEIPAGLPPFQSPDLHLLEVLGLPSLGVAALAFTELIATARSFVAPGDPPIRANRELLAIGAANVVSGLFTGMPAAASTSQTAVNRAAGARTQIAEAVTAAMVVLVLLLLSPLIARMPKPVLDAIVVTAAIGLIDFKSFAVIRAVNVPEFWWAVLAAVCVVLFGVLPGILTGVLASFLGLLHIADLAEVEVMAPDAATGAMRLLLSGEPVDAVAGAIVARPQGVVYFGNAAQLCDKLKALCGRTTRPLRSLILDAGAIPYLEFSGLKMLRELRDDLAAQGITLMMANIHARALASLRRSTLAEANGPNIFAGPVSDALAAHRSRHPEG